VQISALEVYKWFVAKEKTLYHSLNNMKPGASAYIGFFWSPIADEGQIREVLQHYPTTDFKRFSNHTIKPPTYIKSNDFTFAFQEIVNTYGIPMYKEVNPAVFAIVSFPFLFGVMFGDLGHGTLLFVTGLCLVLGNNKMKGTSMEAIG
jgi:V-type H+-transporting ATPase subunit a